MAGKILILELGGIGDAVMSLPAVETVLKGSDHAHVSVLTVHRTAPLVESLAGKGLSNFSVIATDALEKGSLSAWLGLIGRLREIRFNIVIDLSVIETDRAALKRYVFLKLLGAKEIFGRDTEGRGWALTKRVAESLTSAEHEVERKLDVAKLAGLEPDITVPGMVISQGGRNKAANFLSGWNDGSRLIVGINPGAFRSSRMWPEERFREVERWLVEDADANIVITGGNNEKDLIERLALGFPPERAGTVTGAPIMEVAAVIERLDLFITNDTGPMHIAAALNVPTVAIFGQTNLHRYHPYMDPSRYVAIKGDHKVCPYYSFKHPMEECRRYLCATKECMVGITVDEVKEAVKRLLEKRDQ